MLSCFLGSETFSLNVSCDRVPVTGPAKSSWDLSKLEIPSHAAADNLIVVSAM